MKTEYGTRLSHIMNGNLAYDLFRSDVCHMYHFDGDYEFIKKKMTDPNGKQQFFFIKPLSEEAKNIILSIDFNALAERNTSTPGFGKGDFVSYYIELKNKL